MTDLVFMYIISDTRVLIREWRVWGKVCNKEIELNKVILIKPKLLNSALFQVCK